MKRSASALAVAAGTLALCLLAPSPVRQIVVVLGALLAGREAVRLTAGAFHDAGEEGHPLWNRGRLLALVFVLAFASLGAPPPFGGFGFGAVFALAFLLAGVYALTLPKTPAGLGWFAALCLAAAWIGFPAAALVELSGGGEGGRTLLFLLAVVMVGEAGAYLGGKAVGGPKLAPALSPGKTWAGFWAQLIVSAGTAALAAPLLTERPALAAALVFGVWLGAAAALGDLFASYWKRAAGAKDTGSLIPGHGGLLDRVDGILFAALAFAATRELLSL